jgi:hypothetical protein
MQVPAEVLDELVRRLVAVVPDGLPQKESWNRAHVGMRRFGIATDLVVVNEGILAKYADSPGLVYEQALREGKELYHAA